MVISDLWKPVFDWDGSNFAFTSDNLNLGLLLVAGLLVIGLDFLVFTASMILLSWLTLLNMIFPIEVEF